MGFIKSLLESKVDEQEAKRFQSLQGDLRDAVSKLKTALNECGETLKSIRNEDGEESETVSKLQEKIQAFKEEARDPLTQILLTQKSFQDQISDSLQGQYNLKNTIDIWVHTAPSHCAPSHWTERLAREKERETDLQAAAILFKGEDGIQRLISIIERVENTMAQVNDLQEDLDYMLARLREEPLDELEELDALGDRMNQLAKWL